MRNRLNLDLIERAHPRQYVHDMEQTGLNVTDGDLISLDSDTSIGPGSLRAALLAAGAGCQAVDCVMAGEIQRAFAQPYAPGASC